MNINLSAELLPQNPQAATKHVIDLLLQAICPLLQELRSKLQTLSDHDSEDEIVKIKNVFMLSSSQLKKCMVNFLDIIKMEIKQGIHLQESREFIFERLSCCIDKLSAIEKRLNKCKLQDNIRQDLSEDPVFSAPMYFVNWIDYTFEILGKLAEEAYRTDYKTDNSLYKDWKENMVEHSTSLHMCIDELLLSAMTLCKYCLPEDQTVLRARCQVVLRETKTLFGELINDDISAAVTVSIDNLKLPIMPSNVNMTIDVLKDALYVLETNTNTALLALLIHCYVNCASPVDVLRSHFNNGKHHFCPCNFTSNMNIDNCSQCTVVKDFDLYNERLQQIGSFAVSCSSDQKRISTLRSCLSSLESLEPHLVPAVSTSPAGYHTEILSNIWKQEVLEIRDTVFLIVDPIAFVEKCKQYMHDLLLEMRQQGSYDYRELGVIMNIGRMVYDFFIIYRKHEPDAIAHYEELDELLNDVNRAQKECKVVSEFFTENGTFRNDIENIQVKLNRCEISYNSYVNRIKLLYSMVKRVHELIRPKDNDDQLFGEEEVVLGNVTHTININTDTYTNVPKKLESNLTRSVFARSGVTPKNVFLSKLTKHLQLKKGVQELNFSAQVSELFNEERKPIRDEIKTTHFSLRKLALNNQREFPFLRKLDGENHVQQRDSQDYALDGTASLQISEILNQLNDITSTTSSVHGNRTKLIENSVPNEDRASTSAISDATQPSNFTTLERINDLDLVETKLSSLRGDSEIESFETHL